MRMNNFTARIDHFSSVIADSLDYPRLADMIGSCNRDTSSNAQQLSEKISAILIKFQRIDQLCRTISDDAYTQCAEITRCIDEMLVLDKEKSFMFMVDMNGKILRDEIAKMREAYLAHFGLLKEYIHVMKKNLDNCKSAIIGICERKNIDLAALMHSETPQPREKESKPARRPRH